MIKIYYNLKSKYDFSKCNIKIFTKKLLKKNVIEKNESFLISNLIYNKFIIKRRNKNKR